MTDKTKATSQIIQILDLSDKVFKMTMVKILTKTEGKKDKIDSVHCLDGKFKKS